MTVTEAIALVTQATIENANFAAPKQIFDALDLVLQAATSVAEKEA